MTEKKRGQGVLREKDVGGASVLIKMSYCYEDLIRGICCSG